MDQPNDENQNTEPGEETPTLGQYLPALSRTFLLMAETWVEVSNTLKDIQKDLHTIATYLKKESK